jgi:hypothetical protein
LIPSRNSMRLSAGMSLLRLAIPPCIAAQETASTTDANFRRRPSRLWI